MKSPSHPALLQRAIAAFVALTVLASAVGTRADTLLPEKLLPATRPANLASPMRLPGGIALVPHSASPVKQWIPRGFHAVRDVLYVLHGGRSQMMDLYLPDVFTAPRPVMVWIHGGGWCSGDKALPPGLGLLLRGYVVVSINYRLSNEAVFPAQIFDCKAAIRFLRAHARQYDINPTRIAVWGDSAGGHLASLLGTTNSLPEFEGTLGNASFSSSVQAVCDWFGPSDFLYTSDIRGASAVAVRDLFGATILPETDLAAFASPALQAGRTTPPPFLIMHGQLDSIVPLHQSQVLAERLRAAGANVRLIVLPNTGHGYGWFRRSDNLTTVYDFFDRCFHKAHSLAAATTTRPST